MPRTRVKQVVRRRDPERSRAQILSAALHCFVESGYDGASIGAIATRARVQQSLIYHYFPSKLDLYAAVVESEMAGPMGIFGQLLDRPPSDFNWLENLIVGWFAYMANHPEMPRLVAWEMVSRTLDRNAVLPPQAREVWTRMEQILTDMQSRGIVRPDISARGVVFAIVALVGYWHIGGREMFRPDGEADAPLVEVARLREMVGLLRSGLAGPNAGASTLLNDLSLFESGIVFPLATHELAQRP